jgi:hypothetical protein
MTHTSDTYFSNKLAPVIVTRCRVSDVVVHWLQEEEEGIGDVDLFTLVDGGARLAVNAKWLGHLADRQLGEDGHPRKVRPPCLCCCTLVILLWTQPQHELQAIEWNER